MAVDFLAGALLGTMLLETRVAFPLAAILALAQLVASGQAGRNVSLNRVDEIGVLLRAVNQIGLSQRALVNDVSKRALRVSHSSGEIAQGNNDLSARTEQQASALVEVVAAFKPSHDDARAAAPVAQVSVHSRTSPAAERRGPHRSKNVARLAVRATTEPAASASQTDTRKTGTDGAWTSF